MYIEPSVYITYNMAANGMGYYRISNTFYKETNTGDIRVCAYRKAA
ncbi:MAG: hypothetical protein LBS11_05295 [Oscillospiraceae bacterium]|jgi:hypothetical protein|nr:hypothetical protein [Oscillospiraceae bacterium]